MSKSYFFMDSHPAANSTPTFLPDVFCPVGGYVDKNLQKTFTSKGEKFKYLRAHGMREAEVFHPDKSIGGTEGRSIKRRGSPGNFQARSLPTWMREDWVRQSGGR